MVRNNSFTFSVTAVLLCAAVALGSARRHAWDIPAWVPPPREPADNPATPAKVELGRHLFYDKRLSANQTMSCATCHEQARAFTDGKKTAVGITGEVSKRNSMALANVAYLPTLTWGNPQIESLEVQALIPMFGEHPVEMGMAGKEALLFERLKGEPTYQKLFADAFPEQARASEAQLYSLSTVTKAIAAFQRTLLSFNAPMIDTNTARIRLPSAPPPSAAKRSSLAKRWNATTATPDSISPIISSTANSPSPKKAFTTPASTTKTAKGPTRRDIAGSPNLPGVTTNGQVPHAESAQRRTDRALHA